MNDGNCQRQTEHIIGHLTNRTYPWSSYKQKVGNGLPSHDIMIALKG